MLSLGPLTLCNPVISANELTSVYIYRDIGLVVKVFSKAAEGAFEKELDAYNQCRHLQGKVIPELYGSGRRARDGRKTLLMSYVGEPVQRLTPEIM